MVPKLAIGDSASGFWVALRKVNGETRKLRHWMHKTANMLKYVQPKANLDIDEFGKTDTRAATNSAFDGFLKKYEAKYEKAFERFRKDRQVLLAFNDYPVEHLTV